MNFGLSKQIKLINKLMNKFINFDYIILIFIIKLISKKQKPEILCINVDLHLA